MFIWVQKLADWLVIDVFKMSAESHLSSAMNFFIYDSVKIFILLTVIIIIMGIINSYFPVSRVRNFLSTRKLYGFEYFTASLFGVVTPFCSCSSIPLFIGFVKGGIPLGVTLAYLVTSPLVNEVAIGLFVGLFGIKITAIYVVSGVLLGMVSGAILQQFKLEKYLTPWVKEELSSSGSEQNVSEKKLTFLERMPQVFRDLKIILKGVAPYVLIGIAIGGFMHGYIPEGFFEKYMSKENIFAVPIATLLAVPMYSNASGILPVVQVLVAKGIPIGTAIAFMMGVVGLSTPEAMLLKKVMTWKLIGIFFGTVTICIIISGYLFNIFL